MADGDDDTYLEIEIGDLVCLAEDLNLEVGLGIVTDIKNSFEDVYDLDFLRKKIGTLREFVQSKDDDFFSSRPQILVLWNIKKNSKNSILLWMYA
jgi:hypothetical protein